MAFNGVGDIALHGRVKSPCLLADPLFNGLKLASYQRESAFEGLGFGGSWIEVGGLLHWAQDRNGGVEVNAGAGV